MVLLRYSKFDDKRIAQMASDYPDRFSKEMSLLYKASLEGHEEAIGVFLRLQLTRKSLDPKSQDMIYGVNELFKKQYKVCKKVVQQDKKLAKVFGNLVGSDLQSK